MIAAFRRARILVAALVVGVFLSGCQGVYDLPLPGGAATGDDPYQVSIEFVDVLDLVPQSAVKVNDVTVGSVEEIRLDGWTAVVTVTLPRSVELPDNAIAELRQTSLLGEKFVSLVAPEDDASVGTLEDGDLIPLDRSGRNPEVEEVLGALSLLLNGGGVAQLQIINRELNNALEGRESDVRGVIEQLDVFIGGLEEQKSEIVRAIEAIDRLSGTLADQKEDIAVALEQIPGGLKVLADQREELTQMLTALSELGVVATRVIDASQADTVANLEALQPILTKLNEAGASLPKSLELLFTYPFSDGSINAIKGDYSNLIVTLDANYQALCLELGAPNCELPETPLPDPELPPIEVPDLPDVCEALGLPLDCDPNELLPDGCDLVNGAIPGTCNPDQLCEALPDSPLCATEPPPDGGGDPTEPVPCIVPGLPAGCTGGNDGSGGGGILPGGGPLGIDQASYDTDLARLLLGGMRA